MRKDEICNLALKIQEVNHIIENVPEWKKRYILRSIVTKVLSNKPMSLTDIEIAIKEAME
jgi:trehalose-6-phosphate synthase